MVLSGGPSVEHAVSQSSGRLVSANLDPKKYRVTTCLITKSGQWKFSHRRRPLDLPGGLAALAGHFDVAFLALHGAFGEDGTIQALLRSIGLPYTGSAVTASAIAWDKTAAQIFVARLGFPVPRWILVDDPNQTFNWNDFPCFVKPVEGGSSIGITKVEKKSRLHSTIRRTVKKYGPVIVQRYVPGRELTCAVVDDKRGRPQALPPVEIFPISNDWFDYQSKYSSDGHRLECPPKMSRRLIRTIQRLAVQAHTAFRCRGLSRSDFIVTGETVWYLETNTIPGLTKLSLLPFAARAAGMTFPQLLDRIIGSAHRRISSH